jgi:hypothetical protein
MLLSGAALTALSIWTHGPEPCGLIGPPLPLTALVRCHQVPRGCPSTEFDTHEECLTTQPAGIEWTGTRAQMNF